MSLEPRIEAVRARYGLEHSDFWQIPQNKQWVCKHAALEVVATKAGIVWLPPQIIEAATADGIAVLAVSGKMGDRVEWATGEASPKNNKNSYPWAMAEKRAKDRVVLKLAGIHGLVYSEDEMPPGVLDDDRRHPREDFSHDDKPLNLPKPKSSAELKRNSSWDVFQTELAECDTLIKLEKFKAAWREKIVAEGWNASFKTAARDQIEGREKAIRDAVEDETFPGDKPSVTGNAYVDNFIAG